MPCMQGTGGAACQQAKVWCDRGVGSPKARKRVCIIAPRESPGGTEEGSGMGRWGAVIHEVLMEGALQRAVRRRRSEDEGKVAEVEDGEDKDGGPENSTPGAGPSRL